MKKTIYAFMIVLITIGLFGCSASSKPEDTVKNFFEATKVFDFEKMKTYVNSDIGNLGLYSKDTEDNKVGEYFLDYLKENASKITYEIKKSEITDKTAKVTVDCKYNDSLPLMKEVVGEYLKQAISTAFSGMELTEEKSNEMIKNILNEKKANSKVTTIQKTIEINCTKKDGNWKIDSISGDLGNVITSNFLTAANEISSVFGNENSEIK
ncbi:MAG: DUF4878 domain-containing protein [Clostridiales bacterium]|nr:DUF4878 domain-containing protein [Clostridiales bacterium]